MEGVKREGLVARRVNSSVSGFIGNVKYEAEAGGSGDAREAVEEVGDGGVGRNDGGSAPRGVAEVVEVDRHAAEGDRGGAP